MKMVHIINPQGVDEMRVYNSKKHKKSGKHDGIKPADEKHIGSPKTPPRFENHKGQPTE